MKTKNWVSRLHILVKGKHFYDIGLRKGNNILSKRVYRYGLLYPRYLEDFIEIYGKNKIKIIGYGKLEYEKEYINELLE